MLCSRAICENCRLATRYYCTEQEALKISRKENCFFVAGDSMNEGEKLAYRQGYTKFFWNEVEEKFG